MIQHRLSTSSLQHNVVLHSNINESSTNRSDLNLSNENDQIRRQTNSLMPVYEHGSTNDLLTDESWQLKSPKNEQITDEKQMV